MGYQVSTNLDQAIIDRAEADAFAAYISPILPNADREDDCIKKALADLSYLLLLQRTLRVTRGGTKEKTSQSSMNAGEWAALTEQTYTAALAVDMLRKMDGAVSGAKVTDIGKIYFKTQFLYS